MHMCELTHFSCVWLWDPMDCSPPGSPVLGILQARILEWVAMFSSKGSSWPRDRTHISYVSCIGRQIFYWRLCRFFNAIPLKMSTAFFTGTRTDNFKMCMRTQKTLNNQNNIEKGEQCWRSHTPWLHITLQSYSHQNSRVLAQTIHICQWNRIQSPEINPYKSFQQTKPL